MEKDDGGYLQSLVERCQALCRQLPSYHQVHAAVVQEAERTQVLALNHISDPQQRDAALRRWAATECPDERDLRWYEICAGGSASLAVLALLALAANENVTAAEVRETQRAYWPTKSIVAAMLDAFADQAEDAELGHHSYVAHYPSREEQAERLAEHIRGALLNALSLRDGHKHAIIVSSMVAMYLSKDSVRVPEMRSEARALVEAGGSLTRVLLPVLRLWRIFYSHRSA